MSRLTAAQRKRIEPRDFAGPDRSYPIEDKNHAKNALSRVSEYGSSELKAQVRAKVHKKYPNLGEGEKAKERADKPKRDDGGAVPSKFSDYVLSGGTPEKTKAAMTYVDTEDNRNKGDRGPTLPRDRWERKRGGRLKLDAGAGSGVGRLEQAQALKKKERIG